MFRKLAIIIVTAILLSVNANAGSDGELTLKKNSPKEIKETKDSWDFFWANWNPIYAGNIAIPHGLNAATEPALNAKNKVNSIFYFFKRNILNIDLTEIGLSILLVLTLGTETKTKIIVTKNKVKTLKR